MKIWIKYLIGIALGITMSLVLPIEYLQNARIIPFLAEIAIRSGRFFLIPMLFFSIVVAVYELRDSRVLFKTALVSILVCLFTTILFTLIGFFSVYFIKLPRIPISVDKVSQGITLDIKNRILQLFPYSGFQSLLDGVFLLPVMVFAGFAGAGCAADKTVSKATITLFDSISHVCYLIMNFFVDFLAIGLIAIACKWGIEAVVLKTNTAFMGIILVVIIDFALILLVFYPLILRIVCRELHPYKIIYASIAPVILAFISGDANLSLVANLRHAKESLGIRRRAGTVVLPIMSIFARGGAALTTVISFIVILRSYSSLGIPLADLIWIISASCISSFFLGALPSGGMYIAITILCGLYGRGFEAGYLLLKPIVPIICSLAAAIDAATVLIGSYIVSVKLHFVERKDLSLYI